MNNSTKKEKSSAYMLKMLFATYYDKSSGKLLDYPKDTGCPIVKSRESENWAKRLLKVLTEKEFFNKYTFDYISDPDATYKSISYKYKVNFNTIRSSIWYYMSKFDKVVDRSDLEHLISGNKYTYYSIQRFVIDMECDDMVCREIIEGLSCKIPDVTASSYITADKVEGMLQTVEKCSKLYAERLLRSLDSSQIGYLKYLVEYPAVLGEYDRENLNRLKEVVLGN